MKRRVAALFAMLAGSWAVNAAAGDHGPDHRATLAVPPHDAPFVVTINPEGRISVALGSALPSPVPCGTPVEFTVKIVNQGFITGHLEAQLAGDPAPSATLDLPDEALKGVPEETRTLRITLRNATPTDLTIVFRVHNDMPSPGGRDRVHFLMSGRLPPLPNEAR